jgi:hypothetical protein
MSVREGVVKSEKRTTRNNRQRRKIDTELDMGLSSDSKLRKSSLSDGCTNVDCRNIRRGAVWITIFKFMILVFCAFALAKEGDALQTLGMVIIMPLGCMFVLVLFIVACVMMNHTNYYQLVVFLILWFCGFMSGWSANHILIISAPTLMAKFQETTEQ